MPRPCTKPGDLARELPRADWRARFRRRLRAWYARHARHLPWRQSRDPYLVWISEIMLQQTQVATVEAYFERFRARFPDLVSLARADEDEVLRLWEGLGYYRRARQLHRAAGQIVRMHGGRFPRRVEALRALPGIGPYTAGAILSIAFDLPAPILEANTMRLFSRLLAYRGQPASAEGTRLLWAMAEAILPRRNVGTFNQALMELGSEVCRPRGPRCGSCPVATLCRAKSEGAEDEIPPPKPRPAVEDRHEVALVVYRGRRVLLVRRPRGGRWAGLWDFPRYRVDATGRAEAARQAAAQLKAHAGIAASPGEHLRRIQHAVTRFRITLDCFAATYLASNQGNGEQVELEWLPPAALGRYPLNTTGRKLAGLIAGAASRR